MYSLVSAPVLGFDLVRLLGGSAVAEVLLRALSFTESDMEILANSRLDEWDRLDLWQDVDTAARQRQTVRDLSTDEPDAERTLALLERAPIGTVDGLLHCVRHDVLDWTWRPAESTAESTVESTAESAAEGGAENVVDGARTEQSDVASRATAVICDAVVAAYLRDLLPVQTRRRLAAGWLGAARWLPVRTTHLGPQHDAITSLLARVRALHPAQLGRLVKAAEVTRRGVNDWAPAVHAASWAVYVSGRIREAAAAQMLLVRAVEDAGIPVSDRAGGVWNLLSGAVQALVVRDMLAVDVTERLIDPLLLAFGPTTLPTITPAGSPAVPPTVPPAVPGQRPATTPENSTEPNSST
jgi:hypothetical protein